MTVEPRLRAGRRGAAARVASSPAAVPAVVVALVLALTASRYGLHGDELYFRMLPLAWWYDDQPPLTVWLSRAAAAVGDEAWVQRLPAIVAASTGVVLAGRIARVAGYDRQVQRAAAWAHAAAVYPLVVGHVFLTSSIDLVVWQGVVALVLHAVRGHPRALAWAGLVAGLGCWNKLLVLPLVGALGAALLVTAPRLLRSPWAWAGAAALVVVGGVQVGAQLLHGLPMTQVSGDLAARDGGTKRLQVLPLVVAFTGPPLLPVLVRGLCWRPDGPGAGTGRGGRAPVLLVAGALLVAWTVAFPAQPYYPVGLFLAALAVGWGPTRAAGSVLWRRRWAVVAASGAVAALVALPLLPTSTAAYRLVAAVDPVQRDQVGWPDYVAQVARARTTARTPVGSPVGPGEPGGRVSVVTDGYALAGALAHLGPRFGIERRDVASGHNALWSLGPPPSEVVLLVGPRAAALRGSFAACRDVGRLAAAEADPFGVAGSPLVLCSSPRGGWPSVWGRFRHLGA